MPCGSNETKAACVNYTAKRSKQDMVKTALQTVLTLLVGLLCFTGEDIKESNSRIEGALNDYDLRITKIEAWMGEGRRYTKHDAEQDHGILIKLLESQDKSIQDHEGRLRILERQ